MNTLDDGVDLNFPGKPKVSMGVFWCAGLTLLVAASILPTQWWLDDIDRQYSNFATMGLGLLAAVFALATVWLYPRLGIRTKLLLGSIPLVGLAIAALMFEFVGFSGEMLPVFRMRTLTKKSFLKPKALAESLDGKELDSVRSYSYRQFLGNNRNGMVTEPHFSMRWDEQLPEILWRRPIGAGWSGFSVAEVLAVTMEQLDDQESVTAFRLNTGEVAWQFTLPGKHTQSQGGTGPRSTPTLIEAEGRWLVVALGATGNLVCLNLIDGSEVWRKSLLDEAEITQAEFEKWVTWGRSASPLIYEDTVIVPLGGKDRQSETKRSLIAFSLLDGQERWRVGSNQIAYASPIAMVLDDQPQIVSVNEGTVTGHEPKTGEILWENDWPSKSNADACASQPVQVDGQRLLLGKGYAQGSKLIEVKRVAEESRNRTVKVWKATDAWVNTKVLKTKFTSSIYRDGRFYALSDGVLECVEADTGKRLWRGDRFGQGQLLVVNGTLLVMAEDGRIAAVDPETGAILAVQPVLDGITWNPPAVAGPYLLVRNATEAVCLRCPSPLATGGKK
jgi:outer membrane protein assembly factor BamB